MAQIDAKAHTKSVPLIFGDSVSQVGVELVDSMSTVVADVPGAPSRPQQLAKCLSLNKDLTSRLVRAIKKSDPVEALYVMPGPAPLKKVLESALQAGVSSRVINRAESAIDAFDKLIRTEFGARADFDAAIAFVHPEARERQESTSKQLAYRGAAGLRGISVDVMLVSFFVHPAEQDDGWCDTAVVNAYMGLRRTRPGAPFEFATFQEGRGARADLADGQVNQPGEGSILKEYCSPEELPLGVEQAGNKVRYKLLDNGIGQSSAVDLVTHEFYSKNHPLRRTEGHQDTRWFFATTDQPTILMVFDLFLHKDVWPSISPTLSIYDTAVKGLAEPVDKTRESDRLDLFEAVTQLDGPTFASRLAEVPNYSAIQRHVCKQHDWTLEDFRGFRVRTSYPFHGSQICMVFDPFST